jgi:hypothetical protein
VNKATLDVTKWLPDPAAIIQHKLAALMTSFDLEEYSAL